MSSALCNLLRDNTLFKYGGIAKETVEKNAVYCKDYLSAKFNIGAVKDPEGKFVKKDSFLEAGQIITLVADCGKVMPKKYKVLVSINPELQKYGFVSSPTIFEEGDESPVLVSLMVTKPTELKSLLKDIDHLVRISVLD